MARLVPFLLLVLLMVYAAPAAANHRDGWERWDREEWSGWDRWDRDRDADDTPAPEPTPEPEPNREPTPSPRPEWTPPQIDWRQLEDWGRDDRDWDSREGDRPESQRDWARPERRRDWRPAALPRVKSNTVAGKVAKLRTNGKAAIPRNAPARVRAIIVAANRIIGKPYKWGGGHGRLYDSGYDCSGAVSFALISARLLSYPMVSGTLARYGRSGKGRHVTIYANRGHVYMEVAGLRLDTSSVGDYRGKKGVRWRPTIGRRTGFAVRRIAGL